MQSTAIRKNAGRGLGLLLALVSILAISILAAGAAPDAGTNIDALNGPRAQIPKATLSNSFVVLMDLAPAVRYQGEINGIEATVAQAGQPFDVTADAVTAYSAYSATRQNDVLNAAGVSQTAVTNRYTITLNGFSAIMSREQADEIARQPGVAKVLQDAWRQPLTDNTPSFLDLDGAGDAWETGYDGESVYVGVIDSGIWPEHPSFADDGSYADHDLNLENTAANPACDFGNTAHNHNDAPFKCNNKLVAARQMLNTYRLLAGAASYEFDSARDENGHGTHTASTAAGNQNIPASIFDQDLGLVSGVAPRAYVLAYKSLGALGGTTSDQAAAIEQAIKDGVDVINYSIGGPAGPPEADSFAFLNAAEAGVHVATSAGNSGPSAASLGNPGTVPWMTTVGASTQNRFFKGDIMLSSGEHYFGASITPGEPAAPLIDAQVAGGDLCLASELDPQLVKGKIVLCRNGGGARIAKSQAVYNAGGVGMVLYNTTDEGDLFTDNHWLPAVHVDLTPGLELKAAAAGQPYWNNLYVPVVSGGTAEDAVQMAPKPVVEAAISSVGHTTDWVYAPSMGSFSSRGPNPVAPDIIKPDITAPGIQILAGESPAFDGGTPFKVTGELFQAIQGTSMSSPQVAGVFALIDQAHPDWSPAAVKSAIMTTANTAVVDNDRVSPATPFAMGAGHIDPGHAANEGSPFQPGLVYDAGLFDYLGFLCDAAPEEAFINPELSCAFLQSMGFATDAYNLNSPSIGIANLPGTRTVERVVTSVAEVTDVHTYTVSVDAPQGFEIDVEPAFFTIAQGAEVLYEVTATNVDAPIGEWRFGSLTWTGTDGTDSVYEVTSPIALQAGLIDYPANLRGEDAESSSSFEVEFGFSGDYDVAPHGLVAANITEDTVAQDPDQDFNPGDGYSNMYQYDLTGAGYFRVLLPPDSVADPNIDLDLFLFDADRQLYAVSGNSGTDEEIIVILPQAGLWTLFVHGYDTLGPTADFTMFDWTISAKPGGSLVVDDVPDAVKATTGEVQYSWAGLTDSWYMGAFAHSGNISGQDPIFFGITVLEVDNRSS